MARQYIMGEYFVYFVGVFIILEGNVNKAIVISGTQQIHVTCWQCNNEVV